MFVQFWVGAHFRQQPSLLLQCLALILFTLVEFQTPLKDCLQRLLADDKIGASCSTAPTFAAEFWRMNS